jgi:DNA mismatch repair protein MutL
MGNIIVLDENMINMIAAGEVVERPASVVKELMENSIDAGAAKIVVTVEDGGKKLIAVTDDGGGMDGQDLWRAFLPHATSKIKTADDLAGIMTMGFRGEALASIASVSQVRAVSRQKDSLEAAFIEIDCGVRKEPAPTSGAVGTTIEVRDLFYKIPARQKFLRSTNTEMTHITEQFTRIALAHDELDLTLIHNGREMLRLLAGQGRRRRIASLFSQQIASDLLEIDSPERQVAISGFIGLPAGARSTSDYQYTFLNGRFIRDKFISHAIKEAYRGIIEPGKMPVVFLFLTMPCQAYDVNVHPTKIEVRFDNANLVHSQVLAVMREKLLATNLDALAQMPRVGAPALIDELSDNRNERREQVAQAMADFFKENRPSMSRQNPGHIAPAASHYPAPPSAPTPSAAYAPHSETLEPVSPVNPAYNFVQVHDSYIVVQVDDGFSIIDQHALHERIIYEDLCRKVSQGPLESQRLLIPETLEVTATQAQAIDQYRQLLEKVGIRIEAFGPRTVAIQAFPMLLGKLSPQEFVQDLLDLLTDKNINLDVERLCHEILDMAACKAAIKAGQKLLPAEIEELLANKEVVDRASRCPHGRPTTIKFSLSDLEKQFKRT